MAGHRDKAFDCVAMKRRIQERIDAETRGMDPDELVACFRRRVATSEFAAVFSEDAPPVAGSARGAVDNSCTI